MKKIFFQIAGTVLGTGAIGIAMISATTTLSPFSTMSPLSGGIITLASIIAGGLIYIYAEEIVLKLKKTE